MLLLFLVLYIGTYVPACATDLRREDLCGCAGWIVRNKHDEDRAAKYSNTYQRQDYTVRVWH